MRNSFVLLSTLAPLAAHAIVATTSQVAPGAADASWSFVGSMSGASAVAVGSHSVLTAGHVGGGSFILGGVSYRMASTEMAPKVGKNATDLRIVHLADALPGWYDVATSVSKGAAVTIVGFGGSGVVNAEKTGYSLTSGGARHAGANEVSSKETTSGRGPTMRALLNGAGEAVVAGGDSGGGWFSRGKLVGISSFTYTKNAKKAAYGFAKKAYFGSGAIDLTNSTLKTWLAGELATSSRGMLAPGAQAVPEPGSLVALALGAGAFVRRRRKG